MIKAVFFDLDGTLISHTIHDIPSSTLWALHALHEKGVLLFLATGRHRCELAKLPLHGFPFDGYVTLTGQICYDGGFRPICRYPIPEADERTIAALFERQEIPLVLDTEAEIYINCVEDIVEKTLAEVSTEVPRLGEYRGEHIYLATTFGDQARFDALLARLPGCKMSSWHPDAIDIVPAAGGKVMGLVEVLKHYGLTRSEIMAFGDSRNDMDMIRYAQIGVAMGNSPDEVKAVADYVTGSVDEDGICVAMRRFGILD